MLQSSPGASLEARVHALNEALRERIGQAAAILQEVLQPGRASALTEVIALQFLQIDALLRQPPANASFAGRLRSFFVEKEEAAGEALNDCLKQLSSLQKELAYITTGIRNAAALLENELGVYEGWLRYLQALHPAAAAPIGRVCSQGKELFLVNEQLRAAAALHLEVNDRTVSDISHVVAIAHSLDATGNIARRQVQDDKYREILARLKGE